MVLAMELEYYVMDPDGPESDWETILDLMKDRSEDISHPHHYSVNGKARKVAEELGMSNGYQQGDFGIYTLENFEEVYHAVNDDGWHIVGEREALDGFIPEIYSIWTEKGKLDI